MDDESAGEALESTVSGEKGLLRAGRRIRGWDLEAFSASGVSGLRFAESRVAVASILVDISVSELCGAG